MRCDAAEREAKREGLPDSTTRQLERTLRCTTDDGDCRDAPGEHEAASDCDPPPR